ncbi:hypothetical protein [Rhizobium sp. 2MFCol3.1]|uniref:DUF6894 family protein n=1 Tax=unclassified Rhizobium TaxID=2613769 RepID=UPI00035C348C|nr:hypothetical protein [Rhizobium sp. 2MFCol3.1]
MTKYFFHLRTDGILELDEVGADFDTDDLAVVDASNAAREMVLDAVITGDTPLVQQFEITREDGTLIGIIPIQAVIRLG